MGKLIYITGADGTGKTTQARLLVSQLKAAGEKPYHVWLRFPFFFSLPLLVYARWQGYSWVEKENGVCHGYRDYRHSWLLRALLPWIFLFDIFLAALGKVYLPLWLGKTIICERFVLDMLADLAVACHDTTLHYRLPGKLYAFLLPRKAKIVVLDLDADTIRQRRADLQSDRRLETRLTTYRQLAIDYALPVLSSRLAITELNQRLQEITGIGNKQQTGSTHTKNYANLESKTIGWFLQFPLISLAIHWTFQSIFYMDRAERWFKLVADVIMTVVGTIILNIWWPWPLAWPVAFFLAHTLNFLFNGQLWALLKHYGLVKHTYEKFSNYVQDFKKRARKEPAIKQATIYGSMSRNEWSPFSDVDVRLIRQPGFINGIRACWFLVKERTRALIARFPLDAYILDDETLLQKLNPEELPIELT